MKIQTKCITCISINGNHLHVSIKYPYENIQIIVHVNVPYKIDRKIYNVCGLSTTTAMWLQENNDVEMLALQYNKCKFKLIIIRYKINNTYIKI